MRCASLSARAFTLFTLVVLTSHSFLFTAAQGSTTSVSTPASPISTPPPSSTPPTPVSTPSASPSAPAESSHSSSDNKPSSSSSPSQPPSSAPAHSSSSTPPASSASSVAPQSSSSSASSSAPSSSVTASSTSSTATPSKTDTSTGVTLISAPPATGVSQTGPSYRPVSTTLALGKATDGLNPTGVVGDNSSPSPKGFLENKGAAAGVFTVVGLIGVAVVFAIVTYIMRRRARRRRDEEDRVYFEKFRDPEPQFSPAADHHNTHDSADDIAAVAAAPDAYPDRSIHYGSNMAGTGARYGGAGNQHTAGLEYPPGTAYAAAASQPGQYQYGGLAPNQQYDYSAQARTSPTHPFADPNNVSRHGTAPPVNQYAYGGDDAAYAQ